MSTLTTPTRDLFRREHADLESAYVLDVERKTRFEERGQVTIDAWDSKIT